MTRIGIGAAVAFGLASVLTVVVAWPVVRAPARQILGHEIVGRHHDPFTVMYQMAGSGPPAPYIQPVTDGAGWLLARVMESVVAYNVLILVTFPLTAATTYALARYLRLPHTAALVVALLFAFTPLHLAHAAYHPHIAQTQWLPLYFLALFAMVDRPSVRRAVGLAGASAALVLSNFYMGLIGAVMTPVALAGYWWASPRGPRRIAHLWMTAAVLAAIGGLGLSLAALAAPQVLRNPSAYGFQAIEVPLYSARWWAYLTPPVTHTVLGRAARATFARAGITFELLEQQIYLGYALLALAAIAGVAAAGRGLGSANAGTEIPALRTRVPAFGTVSLRYGAPGPSSPGLSEVEGRPAWTTPDRRVVLVLWALAATALLVSLGPLTGACSAESWAPACHLHAVAPVFRAYARFAIVVHLTLALAAGAGLALLARHSRAGRAAAIALLVVAVFEYWPLPAHARDVLPTEGHRWLADEGLDRRTLDCVPSEPALSRVPWLMRQHVAFFDAVIRTCQDPYLGHKLATLGYTHALIRDGDRANTLPFLDVPDAGITPLVSLPDSHVYAVTTRVPDVVTIDDQGFFPYEYDAARRGVRRWMGARARWRVRNTTQEMQSVMLSLDVESAAWPRQLDVMLDGRPAGSLHIGTGIASHTLGPWSLAPGDHDVAFAATDGLFRPSAHGLSRDDRDLTVMFRRHTWMTMDEPPDGP